MGDGFLWGVASSGYQCEGGFNGPGQPQNNWAAAEADGRAQRTGDATGFWLRHQEDLDNAASIGLNAFRLSIEWARVQPTTAAGTGPPPDFDTAAIAGYAAIVAACRARGLEPVLTLHHFTHPAWLGVDAWLRDDVPALFEGYVRRAVGGINRHLADEHGQPPVRWFVTLNEPNMLVLNTYLNRTFPGGGGKGLAVGVQAYNRLLAAHVRAYNAIHDLYSEGGLPSPMVTMNTFCSDAYWSENMLLDLLHSREFGIGRDRLHAAMREGSRGLRAAMLEARLPFQTDPFVWVGRAVHALTDLVAPGYATAEAYRYFLDELDRSPRACVLDFLGLDYYDPFTGHIFRPPTFHDLEFPEPSLTGHLMSGLSRKWWDWRVLPEGLHFFSQYYSRRFAGKGVLIAENGMATRCKADGSLCVVRRDRVTRSAFLEAHVAQIHRLRREGVPMLGYLHWSITDNYEWGSFTPRFGLFTIDYQNGARRLRRDQTGDCPADTYAGLVRAARAGSADPTGNAA